MAKDDVIDLDFFDVREYLDDKGIPWSSEGKNISVGWIGINCPFCSDRTNHMGINLQSLMVSCWKCGKRGSAITLIMKFDQCSFDYAKTVVPKYVLKEFSHLYAPKRTHSDLTIFPGGTSEILLPIHEKYLLKRRYDPEYIKKKYNILGVGPTLDDWKFRIIIPVYLDNKLITYVGRDTTGRLEVPYRNAPIEKSLLQAKHTLLNIDFVQDIAIIVEGPLDAWRLGDGATSCFGTQWTKEQLLILKNKNIKRAFFLFDGRKDDNGEAIGFAHKMASDIAIFIPSVEVLELDEGDPDSMTDDEVWYLRKDLGL
jgi:DNA primase